MEEKPYCNCPKCGKPQFMDSPQSRFDFFCSDNSLCGTFHKIINELSNHQADINSYRRDRKLYTLNKITNFTDAERRKRNIKSILDKFFAV